MNKSFPPGPTSHNETVTAPAIPPPLTGPDLLLVEGSLFWDKYKLPIVAAVALLVLALIGAEFYAIDRERKMHAAAAELESAKTAADYRRVIDDYPGTMAAANATLLLGRQQMDAKDYAGAAATWKTFATRFPQHVLTPVALLGAGGALEALRKSAEARAIYQQVATSYQNSFAAPFARLDEAALLKGEHKFEEARHVYENIKASYASSDAARQAEQELEFLRVMPSAPAGSTPAPSSAAAASPVTPVVPVATASPAPASAVAAPK